MTTYVFAACDKHNVKCFSLTSVTEILTGKSWLRRQQLTKSEAAAGTAWDHLKKTQKKKECSRSGLWSTPRNAFRNGMRGPGKATPDTPHLLAVQA